MTILLLLFIWSQQILALEPSTSLNRPTNDPFINYQWYLWSEGQTTRVDIDDIQSETLIADKNADIEWNKTTNAEKTVVAVIDSGVDVDHPELQGRLVKNEVECVDGRPPLGDSVEDKDGNGYAGDCLGWNFAARTKSQARLVDDDVGHGTHITGILAANTHNSEGIAGIADSINVLPIKIYDDKEGRSSRPPMSISERIVKAIEYAISRDVDIINLSLGWPLVINNIELEKAIKNATSRGIIVVAGAGNDGHDQQVFPCAYESVICVGSTDMTTKASRFSNTGGHVDVMAPGSDILSLWPRTMSSIHFGIKGYEIKSGTSQSTPLVAGALALLKSQNKKLNWLTAMAAIKSSARFTLPSLLNAKVSQPIVSFKESTQVRLTNYSGELKIKIYNPTPQTINSKIEVQSLSEDVEVALAQQLILSPNQRLELDIPVSVKRKNADSRQTLIIRVGNVTYRHTVTFVRNSEIDDEISKIAIVNPGELITVRALTTPLPKLEYWQVQKSNNNSMTIRSLVVENSKLRIMGETELYGVSEISPDIGIVKVDIDNDGVDDYFAAFIERNQKREVVSIKYGLLKQNLKPILNEPLYTLKYEGTLISAKHLRWWQVPQKNGKLIKLPIFWGEGYIPTGDENADPFRAESNTESTRLYTLTIEDANARVRWVNNSLFTKNLKTLLKVGPRDEIEVVGLAIQNLAQLNQGHAELIVSIGNGASKSNYVLELNEWNELRPLKNNYLLLNSNWDLSRQSLDSMWTFDNKWDTTTSITGLFSQNTGRLLDFASSELTETRLTTHQKQDSLLGVIKSFKIGESRYIFSESDRSLLLEQKIGQTSLPQANTTVFRSSFLPGQFFTQRLVPVVSSHSNTPKAGIFLDNSKIFAPHILVWMATQDGLISAVENTWSVPSHCAVMNPTMAGLVLNCQVNDKSELRILPIQ